MVQTGLSGCSYWCSNLVPPLQPKIGPLGWFVWSKGYFFSILAPLWPRRAIFWTFLVLQMTQYCLSGCPYWCFNLVPPLLTQNRPSRYFFSILAPLWPRRAIFWTFLVLQMTQYCLSGCPYWCFNLVPPLLTQNRPSRLICVVRRIFLAYFGPWTP